MYVINILLILEWVTKNVDVFFLLGKVAVIFF